MSHDDDVLQPASDSTFMRAAAVLADLDSPLYDEERERDVWHEASAVGFQFLLWTIPVTAAIALWIGGRSAIAYVAAGLLPWAAAGLVSLGYARRLGVDPSQRGPLVGRRAGIYVTMIIVLAGGLARALWPVAQDDTVPSMVRGGAQGGLVGLALGVVGTLFGVWFEGRRRRTTP